MLERFCGQGKVVSLQRNCRSLEMPGHLNPSDHWLDQEPANRRKTTALSDPIYPIDINSIRRAFPPGTDAPPLLLDFAAWLEGRPWGSVGCFELVGRFAETAPIVDGSSLRQNFALFARLSEGSVVGAWDPAGCDMTTAPIVVLGSEGQHQIIAASLEGLLAKIALQRFEEEGEWTDFTPHEDVDDATDELADWLSERLGSKTLEQVAELPPELPDFARWMGTWCAERETFWSVHPAMIKIAGELTAHRPKGKNTWDRTHFEVAISGAQYQMRVLRRGRQPVEEASVVEPLLRELRDQMWRDQPTLGLWYSMSFGLYADGRIVPRFDYETRPMFDEQSAELSGAKADLLRAPRPDRWVPAWLAIS